jgi:hypothetical protein
MKLNIFITDLLVFMVEYTIFCHEKTHFFNFSTKHAKRYQYFENIFSKIFAEGCTFTYRRIGATITKRQ